MISIAACLTAIVIEILLLQQCCFSWLIDS